MESCIKYCLFQATLDWRPERAGESGNSYAEAAVEKGASVRCTCAIVFVPTLAAAEAAAVEKFLQRLVLRVRA